MTATRIAGAAAIAALAVTLSACGGDDQPAAAPTPEMGAVDMLWDGAYGDSWEEDGNAQVVAADEAVAACMADLGFEYTPITLSDIPTSNDGNPSFGSDATARERGTLEFAKEYGYGITTNPEGAAMVAPGAPGGEWVNPNQEYLDSMSETELAAFNEALYGVLPEFENEEDWATWSPTWEELGCSGRGEHEVYGDRVGDSEEFDAAWESLEAEIARLEVSINSDPRVTAVVAEWSECMADAGHPGFADINAPEQSIADEAFAIWAENDPVATFGEGATDEQRAVAQAEIDSLMAALTDEEIATATADRTCRVEVGYQKVYNEVNVAAQQEFYDAHKTDLEAYAVAVSGRRN